MTHGARPGGGVFPRTDQFRSIEQEVKFWLETNKLPGYPLYYPANAKFKLGSTDSGLRDAVARLTITVSNFPHIIFGVMFETFYEIPDDAIAADPDYYMVQRQAGMDEKFSVHVTLTQQNVTEAPVPGTTFTGHANEVWRPWPTPYLFRGGNQITFQLRRLVSYPQIIVVEQTVFRPQPEIYATLVTVQLNSDLFPGATPGSTGM